MWESHKVLVEGHRGQGPVRTFQKRSITGTETGVEDEEEESDEAYVGPKFDGGGGGGGFFLWVTFASTP